MKRAIIFLLFSICADAFGQSQPAPIATLDFKLSPRGHILVPVKINDNDTQDFVFDTGAGMTALNERRISDGSLDGAQFKSVQLNRAHSSRQTLQTELDSLVLASLRQQQVSALLMDLSDIEAGEFEIAGVLGYNFFGSYDLEIDYPNKQLTFYNHAEISACSGVGFEMVGGTHIKFPLSLGQTEIPAILDTGSPRTGINSFAAEAMMPGVMQQLEAAKAAHPQNSPHGNSSDFFGQLGIGSVSIGQQQIAENQPVNVVNLPVFKSFDMGSSPGAIVGVDLLSKLKIMISYSCHMLTLR